MQRITGIEVALYKIALPEVTINIYGESSTKRYYNPVRLYSLISSDDLSIESSIISDHNPSRKLRLCFLRDDLVDLSLVLERGDIIKWDEKYFEIDDVMESDYWIGRNPDTLIAYNAGEVSEHGYSVSFIVDLHQTSISTLDIIDNRSGVPKLINVPKNI